MLIQGDADSTVNASPEENRNEARTDSDNDSDTSSDTCSRPKLYLVQLTTHPSSQTRYVTPPPHAVAVWPASTGTTVSILSPSPGIYKFSIDKEEEYYFNHVRTVVYSTRRVRGLNEEELEKLEGKYGSCYELIIRYISVMLRKEGKVEMDQVLKLLDIVFKEPEIKCGVCEYNELELRRFTESLPIISEDDSLGKSS